MRFIDSFVGAAAVLVVPTCVFAQIAPTPPAPESAAPVPSVPEASAPLASPSTSPTPQPPSAAGSPVEQAGEKATGAPDEGAKRKWYDVIDVEAFVDGYVSVNYNFPQPQTNANTFRAFDIHNGVALHWVGANASIAPDPVGLTLGLRFGPGTTPFSGFDAGTPMEVVRQAYGTLRPGGADGKLAVDFGKFDTPYGAEVADSQLNINYTRGLLNWLAQPYFHTGFRFEVTPVDELSIKAIVVNGVNNTLDNNAGKSGGVQLVLQPSPAFVATLGYFVGPEQSETTTLTCPAGTEAQGGVCVGLVGAPGGDAVILDGDANTRLKHLIDVVVDLHPTDRLRFLLNGDFGTEKLADDTNPVWMGGSFAASYAFTSTFGMGIRGELIQDTDGYLTGAGRNATLGSGTLTAHITPWDYFATYIDGRIDGGSEEFFKRNFDQTASIQATTTLGIIVKSR